MLRWISKQTPTDDPLNRACMTGMGAVADVRPIEWMIGAVSAVWVMTDADLSASYRG